MRIWDIDPKYLCRQHLLGEHRELHGLWNILTKHGGRGGYSRHPETLRWAGKTSALYQRHQRLIQEFSRRGYDHHSPLDPALATGLDRQTTLLDSISEQRKLLTEKPCTCLLSQT